ncbi:MAG TPA: glycosyltransferase [Terriglobales bacterium]|nr:glycosyltransferase [Terriglobales bacterium]
MFGAKNRIRQRRIQTDAAPSAERISVILPVLNEASRIAACLDGLIAQSEEVQEILVIDGGSTDATQAIVERFCKKDRRVCWLDASPIDRHWTGKVWGLHFGLQRSAPNCRWILCVDADVRVSPLLARSLLAHVKRNGIATFSVATEQSLSDKFDALIHPAMLTTLIYRFGSPGKATRNVHKVTANGQCFFSRREILLRSGAFSAARSSLCEDITIVRRLAECGESVGFYEAEPGLVNVNMYASWRETWVNWPRSLPMRDQYFGWREAVGLLGILLVQALPLPAFLLSIGLGAPLWFLLLSGFLLAIRLGVLRGVARAYPARPWTFWLSPLCDLPVVLRIIQFALRRRHSWRGRSYVRQPGGRFEPVKRPDS